MNQKDKIELFFFLAYYRIYWNDKFIAETNVIYTFKHNLKLELHFNTNNIVCSSERKYSVEKKGESFEYKFSGKVIDKEHIKIGEFIIQLDVPLPKDIEEGYILSDFIIK